MPDKNKDILMSLLDKQNITFRQLQELTKISPRILRTHLNFLLEKHFIGEKGERKKHSGKPLFFSLTHQGYKEARKASLTSLSENLFVLNENIELVRTFSGVILSQPSALQKWTSSWHDALDKCRIAEKAVALDNRGILKESKTWGLETFGQRVKEIRHASELQELYDLVFEEVYEPLVECYGNMQRLICWLLLPPQDNDSICVYVPPKEGPLVGRHRLHFIPEQKLREKHLIDSL